MRGACFFWCVVAIGAVGCGGESGAAVGTDSGTGPFDAEPGLADVAAPDGGDGASGTTDGAPGDTSDAGALPPDGLVDAGEPSTDATAPADSAADSGETVPDAGPNARLLTVSLIESGSPGGEHVAFATVGNPPFEVPFGPASLVRGDCSYHPQLVPVLCEPACVPPQFCDFDGTCQSHAERFDPGPIVVTGLKSTVTLTPSGPYFYYSATMDPEPVDGDLFDGDSVITATGAGTGQFPAFVAHGSGVADLLTDLPCPLDPQPDVDLVVTWEPAGSGPLRFVMQSGNHGEQFSHIVCDAPDTGSVVVDSDLLALYLADWHPLEAWRLSRTATNETTLPGVRVQVEALSEVGCMY